MAVSAQVSLYPLGQQDIGPPVEAAIAGFRRHPVTVWEGPMSTMLAGELDDVLAAVRDAFASAAETGEAVMVVTLSNGCPVPAAP